MASPKRRSAASRPKPRPKASPAPVSVSAPAWWHGLALWGSVLVVLTVVAYVPAMRGGFIWDDDMLVQNNKTLRDLAGLGRIWLEPGSTLQYYPLVFTSFWIDYHLWELAPLGYHVVNVLLHAANAVLLWLLLARLALPGAWLAAAVFALHPVHVESVAWICERKNVLSGFFYLAAFHAYWAFASSRHPDERLDAGAAGSPGWRPTPRVAYAAAVVLFMCALFSKTVTASLPAAVLLALWWRRGRLETRDVVPLLPFFAVGAGFGLFTAWLEKNQVGAQGAEWALSFLDRCFIAGRALWFYLGKIVWPHPLVFVYPRWTIDSSSLWQALFPVAAILAVGAMAARWWLRGTGRGPLVAVLFFAGTVFPALGFVDLYPMRYSFVADHFQYLASIGPIALLVALAAQATARLGPTERQAGVFAGALLLAVLAVLTWRQGFAYKDLETLWRDTIAKNPDAGMAHDNLGNILLAKGKNEEAVEHYHEALRVKPDHREALNNIGSGLVRLKRYDEAIAYLEKATELSPKFADAHFNLAIAYSNRGRPADAIASYEAAIRVRPTYAEAHNNLGSMLSGQGRGAEAMEHFAEAVRANPSYPEARANLADTLLQAGKLDEAASHLVAALKVRPSYLYAQNRLGIVYARQGKAAQAVEAFRAALKLRAEWPEASRNLAWTLATTPEDAVRNGAEAVRLAESACEKTAYKDAAALDALAAAYAETGRFPDAIRTAEQALQIAESSGQRGLAANIRSRLDLFRTSKPFREGVAAS